MANATLLSLPWLGLNLYKDPSLGPVLVGSENVASGNATNTATSTPGVATITTLAGATIPGVIAGATLHNWVADANGLFHTSTDLKAEWQGYYQTMLAGHADQLSAAQRLEGNAEAVFENTGLNRLGAARQEAYREDVQRQIDAFAAARGLASLIYGLDTTKPMTVQGYEEISRIEQTSPVLEELAMQGHGLNQPPAARYDGYTNDFQHGVDNTTYYVGGGADNGQLALKDFFDDIGLSHSAFPAVMHGGVLTALNQNGTPESSLATQVAELNDTMFNRVYVASDFSANASAHGAVTLVPGAALASVVAATISPTTSVTGAALPATISGITDHGWTADATGLYHTNANILAEWQSDYAAMRAGNGAQLSAVQRLEGNAYAVFENTNASHMSAARQAAFLQDAQRQFDTIGAAMKIDTNTLGIDFSQPMTQQTVLALEHTIQGNDALLELGMQGHGLNAPPAAKYDGFTTSFQNTTDNATYYVGGGLDSGEKAIASFFDDIVLTHLDFPAVMHNGTLDQLNQNGNIEDPLSSTVQSMNDVMYNHVLVGADFSTNAAAQGPVFSLSSIASYHGT